MSLACDRPADTGSTSPQTPDERPEEFFHPDYLLLFFLTENLVASV
jgi:hypothetical protein